MFAEMPSVYYCDARKAKKAHVCCECRGMIQPGETYNFHHGVWDGQGASFKVCVDCDSLRAKADKNSRDEDNTPFGYLHETVFASASHELVEQYIAIRRKRGAEVPEWMESRRQPRQPAERKETTP